MHLMPFFVFEVSADRGPFIHIYFTYCRPSNNTHANKTQKPKHATFRLPNLSLSQLAPIEV